MGCLTELAEKGIDPEGKESYCSNKEEQETVDGAIATKDLGPVGCVPLQDTLWSRYARSNQQEKYYAWKERFGGVGPSNSVGYARCWTHWYVLGPSMSVTGWAWRVERRRFDPIAPQHALSSSMA